MPLPNNFKKFFKVKTILLTLKWLLTPNSLKNAKNIFDIINTKGNCHVKVLRACSYKLLLSPPTTHTHANIYKITL